MSLPFDVRWASLEMIAYVVEFVIRVGFFIVMDVVGLDTVLLLYFLLLLITEIKSRAKHARDGANEVSSDQHGSTWEEMRCKLDLISATTRAVGVLHSASINESTYYLHAASN